MSRKDYGRKEKKPFWYKWLRNISRYIKNKDKAQILQFLNKSGQLFTRIVTAVLTSHIGKMVELSFFEAGYLAISEAQIAFWMCFIDFFCNIIGTT